MSSWNRLKKRNKQAPKNEPKYLSLILDDKVKREPVKNQKTKEILPIPDYSQQAEKNNLFRQLGIKNFDANDTIDKSIFENMKGSISKSPTKVNF